MGIRHKIICSILLAMPALLTQAQVQTQYGATLVEVSQAWGTAIADYNNDGHDDIFITGHDRNDRIWYWTPGGYVPSNQVLPWSDRHDCAPADFNRDGLIDFYCAIGAQMGTGSKSNELWIRRRDGEHHLVQAMGAKDMYGRSRRPLAFDMNRDGYPDIYDTNFAEPREDGKPNVNRIYINRGGKSFTEIRAAASGPNGSLCVDKGDIDHDGWDDLIVCSEFGPGHLFINNRLDGFSELALTQGMAEGWVDARLVDMNGDGRDDLVTVTPSYALQIWFNSGEGTFFPSVDFEETFSSRVASFAVGDFNGDGLKDIYVVLRDRTCHKTLVDLVDDVILEGRPGGGWVKNQLVQGFEGCGYMADVLDGNKVLLMNGGGDWTGPNYVIEMQSPPAAQPARP